MNKARISVSLRQVGDSRAFALDVDTILSVEETLVPDARAGVTPWEMVDRKLVAALSGAAASDHYGLRDDRDNDLGPGRGQAELALAWGTNWKRWNKGRGHGTECRYGRLRDTVGGGKTAVGDEIMAGSMAPDFPAMRHEKCTTD